MRLDTKFRNSFLFPILYGVIASIIIVLYLLITFYRGYNNEILINRLVDFDKKKITPVFMTVSNIIFQKFQKSIYALYMIKKYYDLNYLLRNNSEIDTNDIVYKKMSNYFLNVYRIGENYGKIMKEKFNSPSNTTEVIKSAFWLINENITKLSDFKNTNSTLHQLTALYHTMPIIRSIYGTANTDENDYYDLIYFASEETNLFFGYPIEIEKDESGKEFKESSTFYKPYYSFKFDESCVDDNGKPPKIYYFKCRDWWIQLKNDIEKNISKDEQITISDPYKFSGEIKFGVTVCLKFRNILSVSNKISAFCLDIDITDLQHKFDEFNKQLSGYFYVAKTNSNYPIYYPFLNKSLYFSNIERLEFDMLNKYYVSELTEFATNVIPNIFMKEIKYQNYKENYFRDQTNQSIFNGFYLKNGKNFNFKITPIFLYDDIAENSNRAHMLSLIYIFENSVISDNLGSFVSSFFPRIIIILLIFILLVMILLQISWHLITTIGFNIIRPIKNLKFQIKGMNAENTDFDKKLFENKISSDIDHDSHLINENEKNNSKLLKILNTKDPKLEKIGYKSISNLSDDSYSEELDEDDLGIISSEMNDLFNTIIDLKNVITFTLDKNNNNDSFALIKYLNSILTFKRVNNIEAEKISESNLGAMLITFKKFNYALFHLKRCLVNPTNYASDKELIDKNVQNYGNNYNSDENLNNMNSNVPIIDENIQGNNEKALKKENSQIDEFGDHLSKKKKEKIQKDNRADNKDDLGSIIDNGNKKFKKEFSLNRLKERFFPKKIVVDKKEETNYFNSISKKVLLEKIINDLSNIENPNEKINDIDLYSLQGGETQNNRSNTNRHNYANNFINPPSEKLRNIDLNQIEKSPIINGRKKRGRVLRKESNEKPKRILDLFPILNLKSRFPKLIYCFKTYFKSLRLLMKEKNFDKLKFSNDILIINKQLNLDTFEKVILLYIQESSNQKNVKRIGEGILEYVNFLIVYKIKILKFEENFPNFLLNSKEKKNSNNILIKYMKRIKQFLEFFEDLKKIFTTELNMEYFKNFLEIISEKRIDDLDLTETPSTVLIMKYYFLKGKMAKICGHYDNALEYFYKSRESLTICDAHIIKKSNKNIRKIYKILLTKIEEEYEILIDPETKQGYLEKKYFSLEIQSEIKNNSKNNNIVTQNNINPNKNISSNKNYIKGKTNEEKIYNLKKNYNNYIEELQKNINHIDIEMNKFQEYNKDLVVLIDITGINENDIKKYENLIKLANGFFENYVSLGDRFGLFIFNQILTPLVSFEEKNINNYPFIKTNLNNSVKNIPNFDFVSDLNKTKNNTNIFKAILITYEYLNKKWNYENEKWILIFSFNFEKTSEELKRKIEREEIMRKFVNLIIIGIDYDDISKRNAQDLIKFFADKSEFLDYNDVGSLKYVFKKKVLTKNEIFFPFEIYKAEKSSEIHKI